MSYRQFGTLKYIRSYDVHTEHIRMFNMSTLGSLLVRGWIVRNGTRLTLTKEGEDAFDSYNRATVNLRKNENDVSERVSLMLNLKYINHHKGAA